METIEAFILGILSVFVVAGMILGVLAFFKVVEVKRTIEADQVEFSNRCDQIETNSLTEDEIRRELDSRLDKLESKLTKDKQISK